MNRRIALVAALALLAGAVATDRFVEASTSRGAPTVSRAVAGTIGCPIASWSRGSSLLSLANVGESNAVVRITTAPLRGAGRALTPIVVAPSTVRNVPLRTPVPSGAIIEYSGGPVVASHSVLVPGRGGDAAPCVAPGPSTLAVLPLRTLDAESTVSLLNVGAGDAKVSIEILADNERIADKVRLTGFLVNGRRRRDFRLGDHTFDARSAVAIVRTERGRVVAEGIVESSRGVALVGATVPSTEIVTIAGASGRGSALEIGVPTLDETAFDARLLSERGQGRATGVPPELPGGATRAVTVADRGRGASAAVAATVAVGSPIVLGARWILRTSAGQDEAAVGGAIPARRWAGVLNAPFTPASPYALIANAGERTVTASVRIFGYTTRNVGPSASTVTLEPGRIAAVRLGMGRGTYAIDVQADEPVVLALQTNAASGRRGTSYAIATLGTPVRVVGSAAVEVDPRAAIARPGAARRD